MQDNMETTHTRQTIAAYDKNAIGYAEKFDHYPVYIQKMQTFQEKHIPRGAHILDLGCGPGNNIKTILDRDASCTFTGVDLSRQFIDLARNRFPRFEFYQQDLRDLRLSDPFDVILASFCIVHLKDDETRALLKTISSLLNPSGCLYLSYMNGDSSGYETTSFSREEIFFNYYPDDFIFSLLKENRLEIMETTKEDYPEPDGSITMDTFIYAKKRQ